MAEDWFKFYENSIHDTKLLKLSDALYRSWTILLCFASKNGGALPTAVEIASELRIKPAKVAEWITKLKATGLFDIHSDGRFIPHNWEHRQYKVSDPTAAARMQRYRKRKGGTVTEGDVTTVTTVTGLRLEEEVDQMRGEKEGETRARDLPSASGMSAVPDAITVGMMQAAREAGMTETVAESEWKLFKARKLSDAKLSADWGAEWFVWCERWKAMKRPAAATVNGGLNIEEAVKLFARTRLWSKHAPGGEPGLSDCQASAELLAKYGLAPDGRPMTSH